MDKKHRESTYRLRYLTALILAEVLVLLVVHFWPMTDSERNRLNISSSEEPLVLQETPITRQSNKPPAPPRPQVTPPEPTDEIIEDEIELDEFVPSESMGNLPEEGESGESDVAGVAENPDVTPTVTRIVELNTPREARQAELDARIYIRFLVDTEGNVEQATIQRIEIFDEQLERYVEADSIGFGIADRALQAARKWKFRAAKKDGAAVRAYAEYSFSI